MSALSSGTMAGIHLLLDSRKRRDRAVAHGKAVEDQIRRAIDPNAQEVTIEVNENWTEGWARTRIPDLLENDISLELGEIFYQLRAALDSVIYQALVSITQSNSTLNGDKAEFPIYIREENFKRNAVNKPPFPEQLREWLLSIQPYIAKDSSHPNYDLARYLILLHDCARIDRHRKLPVIGRSCSRVMLSL